MITIACVLMASNLYTPEWVRKLRDGVSRNLTLPHRFVCLSDVDVPCERIPLIHDWKRWWSKIELWRPGLFDGPVIYFDLDTVIVGSLDSIGSYPHRFTMTHEFYRPRKLCSTAMAWDGDYSFIYEAFVADPARIAARYDRSAPDNGIGDQAYCEDKLIASGVKVDTFRDLFGERSIASYKVHRCQDVPPPDAAAICFHGHPKMDEIKTGWVPQAWR